MNTGHYPILYEPVTIQTYHTEIDLKNQITIEEIQNFVLSTNKLIEGVSDVDTKKDIVLGEYAITFGERDIIDIQVQIALQSEYPFMYPLY